jgi:hypothetical protein
MLIGNIIKLVNHKLANALLAPTDLYMHMDAVIDDINTQLSTCFPTFSDVIKRNGGVNGADYTAIPDKYIRSVVVVGTAVKYYEVDEEGNPSAQNFAMDYQQQLFYMVRDFSFSIPKCYRDDNRGMVALSDKDIEAPALQVPQYNPFDNSWGFR